MRRWRTLAAIALAGVIAVIGATQISRAAVKRHQGGAFLAGSNQFSTVKNNLSRRTTSTEPMGTWSTPEDTIDVEIHAALLYTGKVLMWGILQGAPDPPPLWTPAKLYDPIADTLTDVSTNFPADIVCGGESILPDGDVMVTGGTIVPTVTGGGGLVNTTLFHPASETWSQAGPMNYPRWYPTNVELGNGQTLVLSGHDQTGITSVVQMETYDQTTGAWTVLPSTADDPDPGPEFLYPRMDVLPSGNVFKSAPAQQADLFNPATNVWAHMAKLNFGNRYYTGHVLIPGTSKIMVVGGTPTNADGGGDGATATTETIDLSQPAPVWTYGASLNVARYNHMTLFLADGSLIVVGGNQGPGHYSNPVQSAEIYNFATQQWSMMASQVGVRAYHSVAVLLPDGRVFSAGSTSGNTWGNGLPTYNHYFEIFSPPYLYNGARPTITASPATISYGHPFTITTPDADNITSVALVMPSANTHADDMQQRYVPLQFTVGTGSITAGAPANSNIAPPGYYMLVIVNNNGVPSVMPFVQLPLT
jgi:hypothetical protein